ncbi:MAG: hypothetical protein PHN57_01695 [Candidatus Omnitrophica bacterium]|nr:hypothetical protein [Candidatus Omnitrophota bacterium]
MIVPMKKITILTQGKDADPALRGLRSLGLVHVESQQLPKAKSISEIQEDISHISEALDILNKHEPEGKSGAEAAKEGCDWKLTAKQIIDLHKRLDQLREYSKIMDQNISEWQGWGDFDPDALRLLAEKSIHLRLYRIPEKELKNIPEGLILEKLSGEKGMVNCAIISRKRLEIPFKELSLPKMSLSKMKQRAAEDTRMIDVVIKDIQKFIPCRKQLFQSKLELEKELEFQEVLYGMGRERNLAYLQGYIPADGVETILNTANKEKWGVLTQEPQETDDVPTLIRNPRWISLINPVFKLLEIIPGYRELDISLFFLIFFSIFFGILIGDAGYGLIYLLLAFFAHKKMRGKIKDSTVFFTFYLLSSCAIVWGLLTGSFFGQEWFARTGLKPLLPALNDAKFMQAFCFFLGALHLSLAHSWRALLKLPSLTALADIGWICVLWSAFFFAKMLILGDALPGFAKWILFSGMGLVILFTNPQRNIFKGIGEGLGTLALSLMNNFTDVVSYVRLFAVGMAGMAIAQTCNSMSASVNTGGLLFLAASVAVLVIGHALNIILGPMSVLVHGVRLNVLEFSGHASLTWSGRAYKPLKQ